jgi:hypothetical protein
VILTLIKDKMTQIEYGNWKYVDQKLIYTRLDKNNEVEKYDFDLNGQSYKYLMLVMQTTMPLYVKNSIEDFSKCLDEIKVKESTLKVFNY